jgi:hypothetical protein
MRFVKYGVIGLALAGAGFVTGFIVLACASVALLWSFPDSWEPLTGLPDAPQALLALDAKADTILIRTIKGKLFTCKEQTCQAAASDWSATEPCDASTRPGVTLLFPYVLSTKIRSVWACERPYTDILRTVSVADTSQGVWVSSGVNLLPTDATLVGIGLIGGVGGLMVGLVLAGVIGLAARMRKRSAQAGEINTA